MVSKGVEMRYTDKFGAVVNLNTGLLEKIFKIRRINTIIELKESDLIGKKVYDKKKDKFWVIEKVLKHWFFGWYKVLLMRDEQESHAMIPYEALSIIPDFIQDSIDRNNQRFGISESIIQREMNFK